MKYIVSFLIFFVLIAGYSYSTETRCKFNSKQCFTKSGFPACRNRVDLDKYYEFVDTDKDEIAKQLISDKKRCILLDGNQRVAVQYNDVNKVKILFRGSNQSWWVNSDAVYSKGN